MAYDVAHVLCMVADVLVAKCWFKGATLTKVTLTEVMYIVV